MATLSFAHLDADVEEYVDLSIAGAQAFDDASPLYIPRAQPARSSAPGHPHW
jgi:hypothetical protein